MSSDGVCVFLNCNPERIIWMAAFRNELKRLIPDIGDDVVDAEISSWVEGDDWKDSSPVEAVESCISYWGD